jgi:hypothetical protein
MDVLVPSFLQNFKEQQRQIWSTGTEAPPQVRAFS